MLNLSAITSTSSSEEDSDDEESVITSATLTDDPELVPAPLVLLLGHAGLPAEVLENEHAF